MQHQGANDIHGVGVDIGEWSSNELAWLPQHPSLQPSPSYYPPVVAAAASGPSVYYPSPNPYDPRSIQPWHAVGQQAPLFPPQYHPTTSVPAVPLPHLTVPVLVHYPLTTDHLPTTSDADIFGSPTVVSRSPISAPHSPVVPPAPAINNSNPKPATKSKGRRNWPCPECQKPFNRPSARDQHRRRHTGEKPHVCNICNIGFASKSNFKRHIASKKCQRATSQSIARIASHRSGSSATLVTLTDSSQ
ncbi:hypothetical protein FRC03_003230 [Tulasnella sp. 419]|nr:hypothetical protein FRC03_003230 [Tulasnella sp. 419]